jgi:hypothetical protein
MITILNALTAVYDRLGDPRTKNAILAVLALLTAFGIIAPTTATALRDALLALAF